LMEAVWMRTNPLIRQAAAIVASGELGPVRHVAASFGFAFGGPASHRLLDPAQAGGAILDAGLYPVHAVNLFLGEPAQLLGFGSHAATGVDAHTAALLAYPATADRPAATATVVSTLELALPNRLEVDCARGRIMIDGFLIKPEELVVIRSDGSEPEVMITQLPGRGYTFQAAEVMRCRRAGETESAMVPWADTLAVARTLDRWLDAVGPPAAGVMS
jgi:predicted dehydrogenase